MTDKINNRIKKLYKDLGYTQKELISKMEVNRSEFGKILRKADKEREVKLLEKLGRMSAQLLSLSESSQLQSKLIDELKQMIASRDILIEKLQKENASLKEQKKLFRKGLYGSKREKLSGKKDEVSSHEENKGDFDGTSGPSCVCGNEVDSPSQVPVKSGRPYRKGMSYKRIKADRSVCHDSDFSLLPKERRRNHRLYVYR